ncbi:NUDIX domain-containing protein [uncultured Tateyamaria sp.]|uniref:NUDIX domain-containing protein n=1 Tax=Tateyamaria sp. 1078 TaxID=3417464 RepID=UPI0026190488|nr:NUDIX domain-containing protein [uncultured Tateyamaria sp.]
MALTRMSRMFFFGTLRHRPLLALVLGRALNSLDVTDDSLPGYRTDAVAEGPFPMLTPDKGSAAPGIVVSGLTETDRARLDYYEAGFQFDVVPCTTASGLTADVYVSDTPDWTAAGPWDLDGWVRKWGDMTAFAAQEVMAGFGTVPATEIARRFPRIRARAWSKVLAQQGRHGAGTIDGAVEIVRRTQPYSDFFALEEIALRHAHFDGSMSDTLDRAVFVSTDAAILLPYDPVRDRVLLVEQIRLGPIGRADPVLWQLEPVAGLIDPGEAPEDAARREAQEEAHLTLGRLEPVGECYASPGAATDFFHLFVGLCDLPDDAAEVGGAVDEGENIRSHLIDFADLLAMAEDRRTANAPLTLLVYWLAHHRARLRMG